MQCKKNWYFQNKSLTAVTCWTKNTAAVAVAFLDWKYLQITRLRALTPRNDDLLSQYCTSVFDLAL